MNPKTAPATRPDLDVTLFDFAEEYSQDPERALRRLQFLLLDDDTCLARVAYRQALDAAAGRDPFSHDARQIGEVYRDEVALVCEEGLFAAHTAGRLTPERVRRLDRLTCDPDALLEAHRRLVGEDTDISAPSTADAATAARDDTSARAGLTGFTELYRSDRAGEAEDRVRPWLSFLLRRAGLSSDLDQALADQFLASIRQRREELRHRRFCELLPVWLRDFARHHNLVDRLREAHFQPTAAELEADAVERVLRRAVENEAEWARAFRESALRSRLQTARALLDFEGPGMENNPALPSYRRDLFHEARRDQQESLGLFECEVSG